MHRLDTRLRHRAIVVWQPTRGRVLFHVSQRHEFAACRFVRTASAEMVARVKSEASRGAPVLIHAERVLENLKLLFRHASYVRYQPVESQRILRLTTFFSYASLTRMGALKSQKCSKGHWLRGKNVYRRANGQRECRACSLKRSAKYFKQLRQPLIPKPGN